MGVFTSQKIKDKSAITLFGNYQPSGVFINMNQESMRDLNSFNTADLGVYFVHKLNAKSTLKFFNYCNTEEYNFNLRHAGFNGEFNQSKKRDFLVSNYVGKTIKGEVLLNAGLSFSSANFNYGNTNMELGKTDFYLSGSYLHFFNKISVKSGLSLDNRDLRFNGHVPEFYYAISPNHPTITINEKTKVPVFEAFSYVKFNVNEKSTLGAGIRKNIPFHDQSDYLTWQTNYFRKLNNHHTITVSLGQYHKYSAPNAEIYDNFLIENQQASIDYKIAYFNTEVSSALFYKTGKKDNTKEVIYGAEVFIKATFTDKLSTQVSYTYLNATSTVDEKKRPGLFDMDYYMRGSIRYVFFDDIDFSIIALSHQGRNYMPITGGVFENSLQIYRPLYAQDFKRLPRYFKIDLSISKIFPIGQKYSLIAFGNVGNVLNTNNIREMNYKLDYTEAFEEYYSRRTIYFGGVFNF